MMTSATSKRTINLDGQCSVPQQAFNVRLTQLAVHKVVDAMQQSVRRMDEYLDKEMSKLCPNSTSPINLVSTPRTRGSISSGLEGDVESLLSSHPPTPTIILKKTTTASAIQNHNATKSASTAYSSHSSCPVDPHVLKKAANDMLEVRNYLLKTLRNELHPFLMKHVIARAVNDHTVQLVRLAIESSVGILDFRALEYQLCRSDMPNYLDFAPVGSTSTVDIINSEISMSDLTPPSSSPPIRTDSNGSSSSTCSSRLPNFSINFFTPPNEFDWFSRDKMGKILSLSEACELFSIIKMAECAKQLKEVYMNAKRATYFASSTEALSAITETLVDLKYLTRLVIRGMCDDGMLKTIGKNMHQLKHLDVSGSQFVTDTGIQHLFFQERNQNYALYLISAWIVKNMDKMNPCTHTLTFLDYSWTCVTAMGRKMVQLLPGSYLFKRLMSSRGEHGSYGHHIFIREPACMHDLIPSKVNSSQCKIFEKHLLQHVGVKGVKDFLKIVEYHPWRSCILTLYTVKNANNALTNMPSAFGYVPSINNTTKDMNCYGIITPNQSEKRIQGVVYWSDGALTRVYTIYPVNIKTLGMLNQLRLFRGIVNEVWRMQYSLLPDLVHLDIFVEPATFINIIQSCPSLRRLCVRIRRNIITDDLLIKAVETSMCRRTLEDVWIAPGKFVQDESTTVDDDDDKSVNGVDSTSTEGNASNVSSFNSFEKNTSPTDKMPSALPSTNNDIVRLSLNCIEALIKACPRLVRLGDLSTWTEIEAEELYVYCEELKKKNSKILILWANMNFPNYDKKRVQKSQ